MPGITAAALERHLRHLRRSYELVPASQLHRAMLARRRGRPIPIAVTFDDDLASHLEVAAPLLRRLACPATFFLTGAGLDGAHGFWWQRLQAAADRGLDPRPALRAVGSAARRRRAAARRPRRGRRAVARGGPRRRGEALSQLIGEDPPAYRLTRSQVRELAQAGFEIGFHTRDHRPLPELTDDELVRALDDGRAALEEVTGRRLTYLAYPHGRADERVAAAARAAGYTDGFGGPGPVDHGASRSAVARARRAAARGSQRVRAGLGLRAMGGSIASPARSRRAPRRVRAAEADGAQVAPTARRASDRLRWRRAVTA